jgi:hypothetical protein
VSTPKSKKQSTNPFDDDESELNGIGSDENAEHYDEQHKQSTSHKHTNITNKKSLFDEDNFKLRLAPPP